MSSVLTPPPQGSDYSFSLLTMQMQTANQERVKKKVEVVGADYDSEVNALSRQQDQWKKVEKETGAATSKLSATLGRLTSIKAQIDNMISSVNKSGLLANENDGGYNPEMFAASFDSYYKNITNILNKSKEYPNLLGESEPTYTYKISPNQETASVTGTSVNGTYTITDTDGKKWILDRSAGTLKRYDSYPDEPTSTVGALASGGIRLDSLVGDQITFTIAPDTADPQTFSGTFEYDGLPVFDSWIYDGLETQTKRDEATADLEAAKAIINYQISKYQADFSLAQFYETRAQDATSNLNKDKNEKIIEKAEAVGKAQEEMTRQYEAAINAVATAAKMQNNYTGLFKALNNGNPVNKFFNLLA